MDVLIDKNFVSYNYFQGVESEKCKSFSAAMDAGKPVYTKAESSLADGLAVPTVGVNAFFTAKSLVDKVL